MRWIFWLSGAGRRKSRTMLILQDGKKCHQFLIKSDISFHWYNSNSQNVTWVFMILFITKKNIKIINHFLDKGSSGYLSRSSTEMGTQWRLNSHVLVTNSWRNITSYWCWNKLSSMTRFECEKSQKLKVTNNKIIKL